MIGEKYQWVKGDNQGVVENIAEAKGEWIYFQSGRRIKSELLQEFMLPINHAEQLVNIPGVQVTPEYSFSGGSDAEDIIIDPDTGEQYNIKQMHKQEKRQQSAPVQQQITSTPEIQVEKKVTSPITLLITKATKDKVKVNYEFEIEIPKPDVYNIIASSFECELNQEIIDVVLSSIDNKTLREKVEEAINNTIKSYYKSK